MKTKYWFIGAIFAFLALGSRAQITEMYYQGFESGETTRYVTNNAESDKRSTSLMASGSQSLKLVQSESQEVIVTLDTLDFSTEETQSLKFIALHFDHICPIAVNTSGGVVIGTIQYKLAYQTDDQWKTLSGQDYNKTGTYSSDFNSTGTFNQNAYTEWRKFETLNNDLWHAERFDLNNVLSSGSVATNQRKIIIRFKLAKRVSNKAFEEDVCSWYLDNIRVLASAEAMVSPRIEMVKYPHIEQYPNGRQARVELKATTSVTAGINDDSVYLQYMVGSDTAIRRITFKKDATDATLYRAEIPFFGYDTLMRFNCVVRDKTGNENTATFPASVGGWTNFHYVRGYEQPGLRTPQFTGTFPGSNEVYFPFTKMADSRSQFIFDSALLADAGYRAGAITAFRYTMGSNITSAQKRNRVQFRLKNVPTTYTSGAASIATSKYPFETSYMDVVYDGEYSIPVSSIGDSVTVQLQDTFFYAGKDIVMQVWYDGSEDFTEDVIVEKIPAIVTPDKISIFQASGSAEYNFNAFTSNTFSAGDFTSNMRPAFIFTQAANMPLHYDAGISELVDPNYYLAMFDRPDSVIVKLKNYGSDPFDKVRISYLIDDSISGYHDWDKTLAGGAEEEVIISSSISLVAGFHTLKVWVEDSVTASGVLYRDHEPLNDTMFTEFVKCDGHMNGIRNIGGDNPDFNNINEFIFALERCGIDDSLIVRVAPGAYPAFTMPHVEGMSEENYIVFEAMSDERPMVYADSTTQQTSVLDLQNVSHFRMRNFNLVRRNSPLKNIAYLSSTSEDCYFEHCYFIDSLENPSAVNRIDALLENSTVGNLVVDSCTFIGGRVGANLHGSSATERTENITLRRSTFRNQNESALRLEYATNVEVDSNQMFDVLGINSAVLYVNTVDGSVNISRNKVYTTHGASGIRLQAVVGTEASHAVVANNMVECNDDGKSTTTNTAINVVSADYVDVAYNAVLFTAPTRSNVPAVTFGGGGLNNSQFVNNMVVAMDQANYAFLYNPLTSTTNKVSHNLYYSKGTNLNYRGTVKCANLAAWKMAEPSDSLSIVALPNYLHGSPADLRTFNKDIMSLGTPISSVKTDMFGTERSDEAPCMGAFEFSALPYDFEPAALISPEADNCDMPDSSEIVVCLKNNGISNYNGTLGLTMTWQINGGEQHTMAITDSILAEDSIVVNTGFYAQFPPAGNYDAFYNVRVWVSFGDDPNQTNDTVNFRVISRYHPAAPVGYYDSVEFATTTTVTIAEGIDEWEVYDNPDGPKYKSKLYWYTDSITDEYFQEGYSYTTGEMRVEETYYVRQRRNLPIIRMTQVEIPTNKSTVGKTDPQPLWLSSTRKAAVQLTNVGDATANLSGDTLMLLNTTSKSQSAAFYYKFGDYMLEPGQSVVMQFAKGSTSDSSLTLYTNYSSNFSIKNDYGLAFLYKHQGAIEDAVAIQTMVEPTGNTATKWSQLSVPSYVWSGDALAFDETSFGYVRTAFEGGSTDWVQVYDEKRLSLGNTDESLIRYSDVGCPGDVATVRIGVIAPPLAELSMDKPILPVSGCSLGDEEVTVTVRNYGTEDVENVEVNYSIGGDVVSETINGKISSFGDTTYTFNTKLNLAFDRDSLVAVRVWVSELENDPIQANDTNVGYVRSLYTPIIPDERDTDYINYATRDTVSLETPSNLIPIWYDYDLNPIDTANTYVTDILYEDGTMGVSLLTVDTIEYAVGESTSANDYADYPSPYQSIYKFSRQQYIYTAADLIQAGLHKGKLEKVDFYLNGKGNSTDISLLKYTLRIGSTTDTVFANGLSWRSNLEEVYYNESLSIPSQKGWIEHELDSAYYWDGVSNLVVEVAYNLKTAVVAGVSTCFTHKNNSVLYVGSTMSIKGDIEGEVSANRPNTKFYITGYGCESPIRTFNVSLQNIPNYDAALYWHDDFDSTYYSSCDVIDLPLRILNQGTESISTMKVSYLLDDEPMQEVAVDDVLASNDEIELSLIGRQLLPGIHTIKVYVDAEGDSIASNDTLTGAFIVRFCAGDYTIAADSTGDYASVSEVAELLNQVGVAGAVNFNVKAGEYTDAVVLGEIFGTAESSTVSFIGQSDGVLLNAPLTEDNNSTFTIDSAQYVNLRGLNILSPKGNALFLRNSKHIVIDSCHLSVTATDNKITASNLLLDGVVEHLYLTNSTIDSGTYAVNTANAQCADLIIENNVFNNFYMTGLAISNTKNLKIVGNKISSYTAVLASRSQTAIKLNHVSDTLSVEQNTIVLADNSNFGRRGIQIENTKGTSFNPGLVANNMISTESNGANGLTPTRSAGIWIDSLSGYINVFFNTVRTHSTTATTSNESSTCFYAGLTTDHIQLQNNVLVNSSYGYTIYVNEAINVPSCNYNAYYSKSLAPFYWKTSVPSLSSLQTANTDDANSLFQDPYFVDNYDLHQLTSIYYGKGQYNSDVPYDIDGRERSQMPAPTIGAHEVTQASHDIAIVKVTEPKLPATIAAAVNIETDSVRVIATFFNNASAAESGASWYAYIEGYESQTRSANKSLGTIASQSAKTDTLKIPTIIGVYDTQMVRIVAVCPDDTIVYNDSSSVPVYLAPAYNLAATSMVYGSGCNLSSTNVHIQLRNEGRKPIPSGTKVTIGYCPEIVSPSDFTSSNITGTVEQQVTITSALAVNDTVGYNFTKGANLMPGDTAIDINFRIRGWVKYANDHIAKNDTSTNAASPVHQANFKPSAPVGHDTTLAYGTWGEVTAEQKNSMAIRWYRDTLSTPFYAPTNYKASTRWSNTPQYFHDSTYFLQCTSNSGCKSDFRRVKVSVAPRAARDMAMEEILTPLGNRVFMENDTVTIRLANYGTTSQNNIPVTYVLKKGNTVLQTVTETITASIAPGSDYEYRFSTLLDLPMPTTAQVFTLQAYTNLSNDAVRRNDTLRNEYSFSTLSQERYSNFSFYPTEEDTRFDVTSFSFNSIEMDIPVKNRNFTNMADYDYLEYPALHVRRGMTDSLFLRITPTNSNEQRFRCRTNVSIDFNRNGLFDDSTASTCYEQVIVDDAFYSDSLYAASITIPNCASLGYMRMRVAVSGYTPGSTEGHLLDFMLFVDEDVPQVDLAINTIASPEDYEVPNGNPLSVGFRVANRGKGSIDSTLFFYTYTDATTGEPVVDTLHWQGPLAAGRSTYISLPEHVFAYGPTDLTLWHELGGDTDPSNDTIRYQFYRYHVFTLTYEDNFDSLQYWYAPTGKGPYARNYWELGSPSKTRIKGTSTGANAWATSLKENITSGRRGNMSYVYSPYFDISQVRPDTISFRMMRNLLNGASVYVEYLNFQGKWMKLDVDTANTWYNDTENRTFNGTSSLSDGYIYYYISTTGPGGNFPEKVQFRFVLNTPVGSSSSSSFGEGASVDDFRLLRARRQIDAGVTSIEYPITPRYGQTIYPRLAVKNYGTDTLHTFQIGYTHYGSSLAKVSTFTCSLPPDSTEIFTCTAPFVITSDYPESFNFRAFTIIPSDIYRDNDSIHRVFYLSPLDNDVMAEEVLAPTDKVVAGDSTILVTLRVHNFGYNDVHTASAGFSVNGADPIIEEVDFDALLGRPLASMEYFNYTFTHKLTAPMGTMNLYAWMHGDNDEYIYNDTAYKRIQGIMSVTDVAAKAVVLDTVRFNGVVSYYQLGFIIENRGTRGVNDFGVAFVVNNGKSDVVYEAYSRPEPLPALATGYYLFTTPLLPGNGPYDSITAFVSVQGDNDSTNDTTTTFATLYGDLQVESLIVEENAAPDCRVFMRIRNVGNKTFNNQKFTMQATINGNQIETDITRRLDPGQAYTIEFDRRIPKSLQRSYVGYGGFAERVPGDENETNDQTNIVNLINYMEGIDDVARSYFTLGQNVPNPFTVQTAIPFSLPQEADVRLFVVDALGHIVHSVFGHYAAGDHSVIVDLNAFPSGIYYYGIEVAGRRQMRKMILQ